MSENESRAWLFDRINVALARGGDVMTLDDMVNLARDGRVQLWANDHAVLASELVTYPRTRHLNCFLAAGTLPGLLALHGNIETFAREHDASMMVCHAAPGYARVGGPLGWRADAVRYVKRLGVH